MLKLQKPNYDVGEIIDCCTSNMRDDLWKQHIVDSKTEIIRESRCYEEKAAHGELSMYPQHDKLRSGATKEDMVKMYSQKFAKENQPGRKYYDAIKMSAPSFVCPYCAQRDVETIDHYLSKAKYPVFAVTPINLVPACFGCNRTRGESAFTDRNEEIIHPYYDDFTSEKWIVADMIKGEPIIFKFRVKCPENWDSIKKQRAIKHFKIFKLSSMYSNRAAQEFIAGFKRIKREYLKGGKDLAISSLREFIEDYDEIHLNTWQAAMYQAVIDADWFWTDYLPCRC